MAKLSARGRTCLAEATREYSAEQLQSAHDKYWADGKPSLTSWERRTKRLMSDGTILEKHDVLFRPGPYDYGREHRHSYGWKVAAKLKHGKSTADFIAVYSADRKSGAPSPWTVTTSGIGRTVVISQARIMRAVESGDSIGFCTSCGADQGGVEPDARGYTCQSCGRPEVCGAAELLSA